MKTKLIALLAIGLLGLASSGLAQKKKVIILATGGTIGPGFGVRLMIVTVEMVPITTAAAMRAIFFAEIAAMVSAPFVASEVSKPIFGTPPAGSAAKTALRVLVEG